MRKNNRKAKKVLQRKEIKRTRGGLLLPAVQKCLPTGPLRVAAGDVNGDG